MIVPQILLAALWVAAGSDPIDRAHGAKPSTVVASEAEQDTPGLWARIKSKFATHKASDRPPQSTSRSRSQASTPSGSAEPRAQQKTVYSNVTVSQLLTSRINRIREAKKSESKKTAVTPPAQEDKKPVLDRLRSKLAWHRENSTVDPPKSRVASSSTQPAGPPNKDHDPQATLKLTQVPGPSFHDAATPESAVLIQKNYPDRVSNLLTRVDSNARWTAPGAATEKQSGTLTPLVVSDATLIVPEQSVPVQEQASDSFAVEHSPTPTETLLEFAGTSLPATAAALGHEPDRSAPAGSEDVERAGPALVDPNAAQTDREPSRVPVSDEHAPAGAAATSVAEPPTAADQPEAASALNQLEPVEPATLEVDDRKAATKIAQTGFVHHAAPVGTTGGSNTQRDSRESAPHAAPASSKSVLSGILSPALCEQLNALPIECYPILGLLLGAMLVLMLARGWRTTAPATHAAQVSAHLPGSFGWPVSMVLPAPSPVNYSDPSAQPRRGLLGSLTATVGLAIIAVGVMAVVRSLVAQQPVLMRPGVVIAATGQFVLLLGIVALAVHGRRSAHATTGAPAQPVVASTIPFVPIGPGYAWPSAASSQHTGQIAQLKAQLACLSQQLDHLGGSETASKGDAA